MGEVASHPDDLAAGGGATPVDRPVLPDQEARRRIRDDLAATLFVEAGAGSGKTSSLVERVLSLVRNGEVELSEIAAITFTEKAAAELRDRVRAELTRAATTDPGTAGAHRCRAALDQLDGAAIGTLHAFAQRILGEHPLEAGLPPRIEVLDEVGSAVAFERRWSVFLDEILDDPDLARPLLLLSSSGVRVEALRTLARTFDDNWDLVEDLVPAEVPDPPSVHRLLGDVLADVRALVDVRCSNPEDRLCRRIAEIADRLGELASVEDELELIEALGPNATPTLPSFNVGGMGSKKAWADVADVRRRVAELGTRVAAVRTAVATASVHRVAAAMRHFTLASAIARRAAGQLQFHDLLVLARALVRDPRHGPAIRARLHDRYRRLLLDEFQDTDPIQIELAVRIAAVRPESEAAGRLPWQKVDLAPGHLFVVGDPKQSIYRFRRADVATYLAAARRLGTGGGSVELVTNFRTVAPVIDWVNATFARLFALPGEVPTPVVPQPRYVDLEPARPAPPSGPPVSVVGRRAHPKGTAADDLRAAEAAETAAAVARALREGWAVATDGSWRPARLGDVAVLVPTRTSLPFLEDALDAAGIPYRAESSSLVYASRAVRDLLAVARAVDDPSDQLAVATALRTPLLGCGDDDLFRFHRQRSGHWSYLANQPDTVPGDDPVRRGLAALRALFDQRHWLTVSELLERIASDRRAFELGVAEGRPRDLWRRLRFVVDQARAWYGSTGGTLREYLSWVDRQAAEGGRVEEAVLPETDDDAVRILTIHSAKGLEFPVTVVSGLSGGGGGGAHPPAEVVFPPDGPVGYRLWGGVRTDAFAAWQPIDEQLELHERLRLLYVACTRARDHLVVSLHRPERATRRPAARCTHAELVVRGMGERLDAVPDAVAGAVAGDEAEAVLAAPAPPAPPPPLAVWQAERDAAMARAARPRVVAATALTDDAQPDAPDTGTEEADAGPDPGLQKRSRNLDLPPWRKGRYGTAVGRAVHGVLQTVDLGTGAGLEAAVAVQCEAEALDDRAGDVLRLARAALGAASVREAAAAPHWRELYVCTPVGDRLLEGYVDLVYRTPAGLVVVDYKTADTSDATELDRRAARYRNQGASYALAAMAATSEPVARVVFVFLTPDGAVERELADLATAVGHVEALVGTGREVLTP